MKVVAGSRPASARRQRREKILRRRQFDVGGFAFDDFHRARPSDKRRRSPPRRCPRPPDSIEHGDETPVALGEKLS
jgi:hypothetical protein